MIKRPKNPTGGGSYLRREDGSLHLLTAEEETALKARDRASFANAVDRALDHQRFSASAVLDRIKEAVGCESDTELAWVFGTTPQNISNRRSRNTVPYREAIFVSLWAKASLDYLLTGRGSLKR